MNIITLTKNIAIEFSKEIINVHNLIPFQYWTLEDLTRENDEKRIYKYKWHVSCICFEKNTLAGICVAFEDNQTEVFGNCNFLYLHRIAVAPQFRLNGIGSNMIKYTCNAFKVLKREIANGCVIVGTPIKALDESPFEEAEEFYTRIGFVKIGEKTYDRKIDSILLAKLSKFVK